MSIQSHFALFWWQFTLGLNGQSMYGAELTPASLWFSIVHLIHRSHWSAGKEPIHCGCALVSEQTHGTTYQALSLKSPAKWDACTDKCSFTLIFTHFFEATGPNCFNVLCKMLCVLKLIDKSLITKTAAKTVKTMLTNVPWRHTGHQYMMQEQTFR